MADFERIIETPTVEIEGDGETIVLHWLNTRIKTFRDEAMNHVEHTDDDGNVRGLRVAQKLMDMLFEMEFPYSFDPVPSTTDMNWFIQSEAKGLDAELEDL